MRRAVLFLLGVISLMVISGCVTYRQYPQGGVRKAKKVKKAEAQSSTPAVINLNVEQVDYNAVATYDLVGGDNSQEAEVIVTITIDGDMRTADRLSLSGDFGPGVPFGPGRQIVWNATADLPPGFDGEINWDVRIASPNEVKKSARKAKKSKKAIPDL